MNKFYASLSAYYDEIFPLSEATLSFLKSYSTPGDRVLDMACGTGTYAVKLAEEGYQVVATDISPDMIDMLREKSKAVDIRLLSMEETDHLEGSFNLIYCIGNSLVHLPSSKAILDALTKAYNKLDVGGHMVIQVINYDRILDKEIESLPTLENKDGSIIFKRDYVLDDDHILFKTALKAPTGNRYNVNRLYPVRPDMLLESLVHLGMETETFGSFNKDSFDPEKSQPFIVVAKKLG